MSDSGYDANLVTIAPSTGKISLDCYYKAVNTTAIDAYDTYLRESREFDVSKPDNTIQKDWNEEFQQLIESIEKEKSSQLSFGILSQSPELTSKYKNLSQLAYDFMYAAKLYGKIICSEVCLPVVQKTIKPVLLGGIAGGEKYIVANILFKFALDTNGIYQSDENAIKAAGHELKGLMSYYNCGIPGLSFPLMALIDFKGFRLVAVSLLPISPKSIIYGSSDGGNTVHAGNASLSEKMKQAAKLLNIKAHRVGIKGVELHAAGDIEGHLGQDSRFYLCDFSRAFPQEYTPTVETAHNLHQLLRPEFVRNYHLPLSPDVFLMWGFHEKQIHDQEVKEATEHLHSHVIPQFAQFLGNSVTTQDASESLQSTKLRIIEELHRHGINVRHLGIVRSHVSNADIKERLLVEITGTFLCTSSLTTARYIKGLYQKAMRDKVRLIKTPSIEPYKDITVEFFNNMIFSDKFWAAVKADLPTKFPSSLSDEERSETYKLLDHFKNTLLDGEILLLLLLQRVQELTGVKLNHNTLSEFRNDISATELISQDIEKLSVRIKFMNVIEFSSAMVCYAQAMSHAAGQKRLSCEKLFGLACLKFERAVATSTNSFQVLLHWGNMLHSRAKVQRKFVLSSLSKQDAKAEYPERILNVNFLQDLIDAADKHQAAIAINPEFHEAVLELGNGLYHRLKWQQLITFAKTSNNPASLSLSGSNNNNNSLRTYLGGSIPLKSSNSTPVDSFIHQEQLIQVQLCKQISQAYIKAMTLQPSHATFILSKVHKLSKMIPTMLYHNVEIALYQCIQSVLEKLQQKNLEPTEVLFEQALLYFRHAAYHRNVPYASLMKASHPKASEFGQCGDKLDQLLSSRPSYKRLILNELSSDLDTIMLCHASSLERSSLNELLVGACNQLTVLTLDYCLFQEYVLTDVVLRNTPNLKKISLKHCYQLSLIKLEHLMLEELDLTGCLSVGMDPQQDNSFDLPSLRKLNVSLCNFGDNFLMKLICTSPLIQSLEASNVPNLQNPSLSQFSQLEYLSYDQCKNLQSPSQNFANLKTINFNGCINLLDDAIRIVSSSSFLQKKDPTLALEQINLRGCKKLTEAGIGNLIKCTKNVQMLDISECEVSPNIVKLIVKHCTSITDLALARIKSPILPLLQKSTLPSLKTLDITALKGSQINLQAFPNIVSLIACEYGFEIAPNVTSNTVSSLFQVPPQGMVFSKLEVLNLARCAVVSELTFCQILPFIPNIKTLDLSNCHLLSDKCIKHISANCTQLQSLQLFGCYGITDLAVRMVIQCSHLQQLSVGGCRNISDSRLPELLKKNTSMTYLDMAFTKITDFTILELSNSCQHLQELHLSNCEVSDAGFLSLAKNMKNMKQLFLFKLIKISDYGLKVVLQNCRQLEVLDVSECVVTDSAFVECNLPTTIRLLNFLHLYKITDKTMQQIACHCKELTTLNIRNCISITEDGISVVVQSCPKLTLLNIKSLRESAVDYKFVRGIKDFRPMLQVLHEKM